MEYRQRLGQLFVQTRIHHEIDDTHKKHAIVPRKSERDDSTERIETIGFVVFS